MNELTQSQIDRQDYVDNAIYHLVNDLVPQELRVAQRDKDDKPLTGDMFPVEWNMQWIAGLRDHIGELIAEELGIVDHYKPPTLERFNELNAFNMAFYPYIEE